MSASDKKAMEALLERLQNIDPDKLGQLLDLVDGKEPPKDGQPDAPHGLAYLLGRRDVLVAGDSIHPVVEDLVALAEREPVIARLFATLYSDREEAAEEAADPGHSYQDIVEELDRVRARLRELEEARDRQLQGDAASAGVELTPAETTAETTPTKTAPTKAAARQR